MTGGSVGPVSAADAAEARMASSSGANPGAVQAVALPPDPVVLEGKKKFHLALEDELLDYKHNLATSIEACANTLVRIFSNVLDNPGEAKYRQVKASSNVLKNSVMNIKGGEHLLVLAGWKTRVENLEKFFYFDGEPGSHKWQIMSEGLGLLQRALATIHEKAERKRREAEEKAAAEKARRDQILMAIEDDKIDRKIRTETQVHVNSSTSPSPAGTRPGGSGGGRVSGPGSGEVRGQGAQTGHAGEGPMEPM